MKRSRKEHLEIGDQRIEVSNLDKVLFPAYKFTKANVIDYYIRISKYLLPHLKNRPVTLKRFPNGVFGKFFYEKDAPAFTPDWVRTFPVPRRERNGPDIRYVLINDLPTLVWLANLANLELHPFLHRVPKIDQPTSIVFDCDPGAGADVLTCVRVAGMLRETLAELGLESFPKVSGSKGLQVCVPLNAPVTYQTTLPLAKTIAELLTQKEPKLIVAEMAKSLRRGKVFIDWSQNSDFKTTVGVYSLRAKTYKPFVSMPVTWEELREALDAKDAALLYFNPETALARVEKLGDLFKPVLKKKQELPRDLKDYFRSRALGKRTGLTRGSKQTKLGVAKNIRSSRQGSKRRFIVQTQGKSDTLYLESQGVLKSWTLWGPITPHGKFTARQIEDAPLNLLTEKARSKQRKTVSDVGTYELIEGDLQNGFARLYMQGAKLKGEWSLKRVSDERSRWVFRKD
jgi:bifunctional non-homologous end joining protein LigD